MKNILVSIIDAFYFLFKGIMPLKTYRYAVCGGGNLVLDLLLYAIFYNFIFQKHNVDLGFITFSPHIASLFIVFPITFFTGFLLNKYIAFEDSNIKGSTQLIRYWLVAIGAMIISYFCMKLFVEVFGIYPTPSKAITIAITVVYSYILQSTYSFKVEKE